ncbi:hypothetical protein ABT154_17340 [Streptomyces sp. NPDC001728]|uniref:hypothetical protein n=1 Tax=Streptomyces sp. NPDC001728 TaxID=3154396 RepID=UPI00332A995E
MPGAHTTLDLDTDHTPALVAPSGGVPAGGFTGPRPHPVDLVVDGRPLLRLLDEAEGIDAVPPLASDLPPVLRAEHLRRLLDPVAATASADGRQVIYSCPDCDDPGCGAVTAVVEREGDAHHSGEGHSGEGEGEGAGDVVWRDFAWQTGPTVDPVRDGYPGVGPYRFHGATYRSVLLRLLGSSACRSVA